MFHRIKTFLNLITYTCIKQTIKIVSSNFNYFLHLFHPLFIRIFDSIDWDALEWNFFVFLSLCFNQAILDLWAQKISCFRRRSSNFLLTYKYLDLDPSVISAAFKLLNYFWIYFISSSFVLDFEEPHALNSAPQASIFCFGLAIPCMLSTPGPKWRTAVRPLYDHPPWRSSCTRGDYWRPLSMVMWSHSASGALSFS